MTAPTIFSTTPVLTGATVTLRPFVEADLEALGTILTDPEVLRLTGSVNSTVEADAARASAGTGLDERTREWYRSRIEQHDRLDLSVVDRATDACVGEVVLNEWDPANESCNFRILIGPAGRNRGLGTEATRLLLDYAFQLPGLHRIELEVFAFNPRAQHVYERCGFVAEGRRRAALLFDGERIDAVVMSVLRSERPEPTEKDSWL